MKLTQMSNNIDYKLKHILWTRHHFLIKSLSNDQFRMLSSLNAENLSIQVYHRLEEMEK